MGYSVDLREKALEYYNECENISKTCETFKIARSTLYIPAGKLELNEDPLSCAHRELEEETGYKASKMQQVQSFYPSPGYTNEAKHLFWASDLIQGRVNLDEDEFLSNFFLLRN